VPRAMSTPLLLRTPRERKESPGVDSSSTERPDLSMYSARASTPKMSLSQRTAHGISIRITSQSPKPACTASRGPTKDGGGPRPERAEHSLDYYKNECLQLRAELADRREETRQLQQRVRLLEGALPCRMQQLEALVEDLRKQHKLFSAPHANGERRYEELLDRVVQEARRTQVVLQVHADAEARLEAKDRLLEKAQSDRQREECLKQEHAKKNAEKRRPPSAKARTEDAMHLRLKLEQSKRSLRKQDEILAEYEWSSQTQQEREHLLERSLEEERKLRREAELQAMRLAGSLSDAKAEAGDQQRPATAQCHGASRGPEGRDLEGHATWRSQHASWREEERELRRRRRRHQQAIQEAGRNAQEVACSNSVVVESLLLALAASRERCEDLERACAAERMAAQACDRLAKSEVSSYQARQVEAEAVAIEGARRTSIAEQKAALLTEVANQAAWQADVERLKAMESELSLQRQLSSVQRRCAMLEEAAKQGVEPVNISDMEPKPTEAAP